MQGDLLLEFYPLAAIMKMAAIHFEIEAGGQKYRDLNISTLVLRTKRSSQVGGDIEPTRGLSSLCSIQASNYRH